MQGEFVVDPNGMLYWSANTGLVLTSTELRQIANELDKRNTVYDDVDGSVLVYNAK